MKDKRIIAMIEEGHMTDYQIRAKLRKILYMTIYFDNHKPVYIPKWKWKYYWEALDRAEGFIP